MKRNFLDQFYTIEPDTGDYIIEISLKDYDDVFNTWDSSVYNIRDLDASLKSFLEECSFDIDTQKNIILRFNMHEQNKDAEMEKNIESGIRNYFNYSLYILKKNFGVKRKRTAVYILVSFLFTSLSIYSQSIEENKVISELVSLSLTVGGWVFLWEAFSVLFIQSSDLWKQRKHFKRILAAPIKFRYN